MLMKRGFSWCPGTELNRRHEDFQSSALPTELPGQTRQEQRRGKITHFPPGHSTAEIGNNTLMDTAELDFRLPSHLISFVPGRLPGGRRDAVRMMVLDRGRGAIEHRRFHHLEELLRPGDVLVVNDSLVLQEELAGDGPGGQPMTLILCGHHADGWHVLVRPARRARRASLVDIGGGALRAVLVSPSLDDLWLARFEHDGDFVPLLERFGHRAAPQHRNMKRKSERYRSVYATKP